MYPQQFHVVFYDQIRVCFTNSSGFVAYESNLGQLGRFAAEGQSTSDETSVLVQRVDPARCVSTCST